MVRVLVDSISSCSHQTGIGLALDTSRQTKLSRRGRWANIGLGLQRCSSLGIVRRQRIIPSLKSIFMPSQVHVCTCSLLQRELVHAEYCSPCQILLSVQEDASTITVSYQICQRNEGRKRISVSPFSYEKQPEISVRITEGALRFQGSKSHASSARLDLTQEVDDYKLPQRTPYSRLPIQITMDYGIRTKCKSIQPSSGFTILQLVPQLEKKKGRAGYPESH